MLSEIPPINPVPKFPLFKFAQYPLRDSWKRVLLLAKTVLETLAVLQSEQGREGEVSAVGVVAEKPGWLCGMAPGLAQVAFQSGCWCRALSNWQGPQESGEV